MVLHIKIRKYLKEFIINVCDEHGDRIYGKEPVHFSRKSVVARILNGWRRMPPPNAQEFPHPLPKDSEYTWLAVDIDTDPAVKKDELRTYITPQWQSSAASALYDQFCSFCFAYVEDHLNTQREMQPRREPVAMRAYLDFLSEHNIESLDWQSVRRAYNREKKSQIDRANDRNKKKTQ